MIYEVTGDILKTKAQAIVHCVAPNDHFNQGLAMSLRELWPSMYKDFRHFYQSHHPETGTAWIWSGSEKRIISLLAQEPAKDNNSHPGHAKLESVNKSLKELRKLVEKENINTLALPKLATGVGGLDWKEVFPLIQKHLGDLKINIYVYTQYQKGVQAQENLNH